LTVALADGDGPTPPPEAVAMFVIETAVISFWVVVYVAWQVTVAFGASVLFAAPQLKGVALIRLSLTVNCAGPRATVPVFLISYANVIVCPAWLYVDGLALVVKARLLTLLLTVALAEGDGPAPPPEAVAMFVIETAVISFWVVVYVAWQVTVVVGARVVFAAPQLIGVALMRVSLTVN
jgi:hypothetical protein